LAAGGDLITHHVVRQDKEADGADLTEGSEPLLQPRIERRVGKFKLRAGHSFR
jgi:hypothetical protein